MRARRCVYVYVNRGLDPSEGAFMAQVGLVFGVIGSALGLFTIATLIKED